MPYRTGTPIYWHLMTEWDRTRPYRTVPEVSRVRPYVLPYFSRGAAR